MRTREGLNSINSKSNNGSSLSSRGNTSGKVYGVVLDENTPSKKEFKDSGGWDGIGTIYYLDYDLAKPIENPNLNLCKTARPLFPNIKTYPLLGEVVLIFDLPSNQDGNTVSQKYYLSTISMWNNPHHNAQTLSNNLTLGKTFKEKDKINTVLPFEGDVIYEGRFGQSLRFGSTTSLNHEVSGSPITMLVNNHNFDGKSLKPYVENINEDGSSFYMSSDQKINLKTEFSSLNPFTNTIKPEAYTSNQIILNSDRVLLNSKQDDVLIFSKTNTEIYAGETINLNANERIHHNSKLVFLGQNGNKLPDEPALLGNKTVRVIKDIISELSKFSSSLQSSISTPAGSPLVDINVASTQLNLKLNKILLKLDSLTSSQIYIS